MRCFVVVVTAADFHKLSFPYASDVRVFVCLCVFFLLFIQQRGEKFSVICYLYKYVSFAVIIKLNFSISLFFLSIELYMRLICVVFIHTKCVWTFFPLEWRLLWLTTTNKTVREIGLTYHLAFCFSVFIIADILHLWCRWQRFTMLFMFWFIC